MKNRISRYILFAVLAACVLTLVPAPAQAQRGFARVYWGGGPYWGAYWGPWGWAYPGPYAYGYPGRPLGQLEIKSPVKDAQIFINGAFAGKAHDMKHFYLAPGTYNIEQRIGADVQKVKVYVTVNNVVKIAFDKPGVVRENVPVPAAPQMAPPPAPANQAPAPLPPPPPPAES